LEIGSTRFNAGVVEFALQHRNLDGGKVGAKEPEQGVCIQVIGQVQGKETELLRFDCFDLAPHYHYGPEGKNEQFMIDKTTAGNPVGWSIRQLRERLPDMLRRAGYEDLVGQLDGNTVAQKLDEVESSARGMAISQRGTVKHNRGDAIIEAGAIRFGLEYRHLASDRGQAIHVLGDVEGQEIELLAFDCFDNEPHYHYGPRNKNERIFWDKTVVPDTLTWTLDQFKAGSLVHMIQRAGYPGIVAELDARLIHSKLPAVESQARAMVAANAD
jgi:hypothetical protein